MARVLCTRSLRSAFKIPNPLASFISIYLGVTEKVARFLSGSEKIIKSNQNIEK
jgi:hypothetical protein